ncbi:predicted protein [Pyrenophora tritici-repentis Pt-1C-BFP]|uniref:Uncharacterized protein n=1 Tax=Pyrenophora tritici-repentis (strain Pt-1C-BFP) TaxID=426418 RepID=B2VU11_PYRTR|nr:uncharacterized protein PTRG_00935 [Pyrenophora tritici-repentis Pt-1C-BFP]EDU40373.1 predicted protein [Pyrenophora tritici-repentis Pt-1C-BFP]
MPAQKGGVIFCLFVIANCNQTGASAPDLSTCKTEYVQAVVNRGAQSCPQRGIC